MSYLECEDNSLKVWENDSEEAENTLESGEDTSKIMIIEDNCITLNQLQDYLIDQGYRIIPCKQSETAQQLLGEVTPDLILLDIIMPNIDGYQFCKWLRSHSRLKRVPIVFLTALNSLEDKLEGFQMGGDDYITKPFEMEELLARVQAIIKRSKSYYEISMKDELTNAYNRRYLNERLGEEIHRVKRTGRPFSIVVLDIDFFKVINDSYGHYAGDAVLAQFVEFLQTRLRKSDLVARLGGDEFILLLPDTTSRKAYVLIERLRRSIELMDINIKEDGKDVILHITFSAGIACCSEHGDIADTLFTVADGALYSAKKSGRNATRIAVAAAGAVPG